MADFDYSQDGAALGDSVRDLISPFDGTGIDPDEARADQGAALASINGTSGEDAIAQPPAQNAGGTGRSSPNGNELPAGLYARSNPTDRPDAQQAAQSAPAVATPAGGGGSSPASSQVAPAGGTSAGTSPVDWATFVRNGGQSLQTNMDRSTQAAQQFANQPSLLQTNAALQAKIDNTVSNPPNPSAARYKVGVGSKILRGLEGAGMGIARGGVLGGLVGAINPRLTAGQGQGYSDPSSQYYQDQATNQAKLAAWQAAEKQNDVDFAADTTRGKDVSAGFTAAGNMGKELAAAGTAQENAETEQQKVNQTSPQGKVAAENAVSDAEFSQRKLRLSDKSSPLGRMPANAQAYFLATGKVAEPNTQQAPAEEVLFNRAYGAWTANNPGKRPTVDDIRTIASAAKGVDPNARSGSVAASNARALLRAATQRLAAANRALGSAYGDKRQAAQDEVDAAQKAYDEADAGLEPPPAPAAPATATAPVAAPQATAPAATKATVAPAATAIRPPGSAGTHSLATAMALPFNKGKSAAQVKADLIRRGYTVVP